VIQIDNEGFLKAQSIKAEDNYAYLTAGVIQVMTYSSIEVYDSLFTQNYAN